MGCGCKKRNEEQPIQSVPLTITISEPQTTPLPEPQMFSVDVSNSPSTNENIGS